MSDDKASSNDLRQKLSEIAQRLDKISKENSGTENSENGGGYQF